jgi:hypothetical protein
MTRIAIGIIMGIAALFCLFGRSIAQTAHYDISTPLDIQTVGWNKVLCLKNGGAMLVHMEPSRPMMVKIFDSTHKEIAGKSIVTRYLDLNRHQEEVYKGMYEINGEGVLFVEQEKMSKHRLLRLRISEKDGSILEEKVIHQSAGQSKRTRYYVLKTKADDHYEIFYCLDQMQYKESKLNMVYYNNRHEAIREVQLKLDRKQYDQLELLGAEEQESGIFVTFSLQSLQTNSSRHFGDNASALAVFTHDLHFFYIPTNATEAKLKVVEVGTDAFPYFATYTHNKFANTLNLLVYSYRAYTYKYGLDFQQGALMSSLFFNFDETNMGLKYTWLKNTNATAYTKRTGKDTAAPFRGVPVKMHTNENGLTTVVYQNYTTYRDQETSARSLVYNTYFGHIAITQIDDDGNEIWGTSLPLSQYHKSYQHYYYPDELSNRWQDQYMFADLPAAVYQRQFVSLNTYFADKNIYLVFNDLNKNSNATIEKPGDTVYDFTNSNVCYYKMTRKKEIIRSYLFGTPVPNEYASSLIEGADFDYKRGLYVTLLQCHKNGKNTMNMGWSRLE